MRELDLNLQLAVDAMKHCDQPVTAISSGAELFMRFITFAKLDVKVSILIQSNFIVPHLNQNSTSD